MASVKALFRNLQGDPWRIKNTFTEDILQANALLHNQAATDEERAECLQLWCQHKQPCQFGKAAAKQSRIHFCFLSETAVSEWPDEEIAAKISGERRLWKQRAAFDPARAAHSLLLVVASPQVALAAPDKHLRAFSDRILELAGWQPVRRSARRLNAVASDYLYLRHPKDLNFRGFKFNIDFFACAGDQRWWRDHRFPGGIAFTANSTGHMVRYRDWYQEKHDNEAWALKQAMLTIQNAAPTRVVGGSEATKEGPVTWLRSLDPAGRPLVDCPNPLTSVPTSLEGKDWTRYEGLLHTDHAVREEFFLDRERAPTSGKPYLMDFTYLYDARQVDFAEFTVGKGFSEDEVYAEVGRPEDWTHRAIGGLDGHRTFAEAGLVATQLQACKEWSALSQHTLEDPEV